MRGTGTGPCLQVVVLEVLGHREQKREVGHMGHVRDGLEVEG